MALIVFRDIIALSSGSDATTDTEQLYKFSLLSITLAYIQYIVSSIIQNSEKLSDSDGPCMDEARKKFRGGCVG